MGDMGGIVWNFGVGGVDPENFGVGSMGRNFGMGGMIGMGQKSSMSKCLVI